jgi:hypothetical protein
MITVRTRKQTYSVDADYIEFCEELNNQRTPYMQVNSELIRKSEITGVVNNSEVKLSTDTIPEFTQPQEKLNENIYVYTYMKAKIPRYMKTKGGRLDNDEVNAVIQEARVSYRDTTV